MHEERLTTYLRTYRRKSGLYQAEVAKLVGNSHYANYSRHERSERIPALRTVLAYEIIFGVPARDLFPGMFAELRSSIVERAEARLDEIRGEPSRARVEATLKRICEMHALEEAARRRQRGAS